MTFCQPCALQQDAYEIEREELMLKAEAMSLGAMSDLPGGASAAMGMRQVRGP